MTFSSPMSEKRHLLEAPPTPSPDPSPSELLVNSPSPVQAARLLAKIDIGIAAAYLETTDLAKDELGICRGFDIRDCCFSTTKWRGITTLSDHHQAIMGSPPSENESAILQDLSMIKENLEQDSPRGLLFRKRSDNTIHCFRLSLDKTEVEYYDRTTAAWRTGSQQDVDRLQLKSTDQAIALGGKALEIKKYHALPSPLGKSPGGFFYHEEQKGGLCGLHSTNAFFGYPAIDPFHLQEWLRANSGLDEESLCMTTTQIDDINSGIDPVLLQRYLNSTFGAAGPIEMIERTKDQTGQWLEPNLSSIPPTCDRAIVGYRRSGMDHFVTVRKDPDRNTWHYIDSLQDQNHQKKGYKSLYDITLHPQNAPKASRDLAHGDSLYILYRNG